ncbi:hypothetical protein SLA2020_080410 [Shorea laevis]
MAIIFENKSIEKNDTGNRMNFPRDATLTNLSFDCNAPGRSRSVTVIDEDTECQLTIENKNGRVCFTAGWNAFTVRKKITVRHKISLHKVDGADRYRIIVGRK